jgi:hypothetical protein
VGERRLDEVGDRVRCATPQDVVVWALLLERQPRALHDVAGDRPVADRPEVAEHDLVAQAELDRGSLAGDLARNEFFRATLRLVVVEDARAGEDPVVCSY